ncbi:hypothetical protein H8356DRAFT_1065969 [Neocallimastix lanati (nom. inval.)]|nr:hypothetical protein H8356DRAFT_1065969 [Neocallimastix sp. JGI-2020a]
MNNGLKPNIDIKGKKQNLNFEKSTLNNKKLKLISSIEENDNEYLKNQIRSLNNYFNEINKNKNGEIKDNYISRNTINNNSDNSGIMNNNFDIMHNSKYSKHCDFFFKIIKSTIKKQYKSKYTIIACIGLELEKKIKESNELYLKKNNECPSFFIPFKDNFNCIYDFCHNQIKRNRRNALGLRKLMDIYEQFREEASGLPQKLEIVKLCLKYGYTQYLNYISLFNSLNKLYDLYLNNERITENLIKKILGNNNFYKPKYKVIGINDIMREIKFHYIKKLKEKHKISEKLMKEIQNLDFLDDFDKPLALSSEENIIIIDDDDDVKSDSNNSLDKDSNNNIIKENNDLNKDTTIDIKKSTRNQNENNNNYVNFNQKLNEKNKLNIEFNKRIVYSIDSAKNEIGNTVNTINNNIYFDRNINKMDNTNSNNEKEEIKSMKELTSMSNSIKNKSNEKYIKNKIKEKFSKNKFNIMNKNLNENTNYSINNNSDITNSINYNIDINNNDVNKINKNELENEIIINTDYDKNNANDFNKNNDIYNESYSDDEESSDSTEFNNSESFDNEELSENIESSDSIKFNPYNKQYNLRDDSKSLNESKNDNEIKIKIKERKKKRVNISINKNAGHYNLRSNSNVLFTKENNEKPYNIFNLSRNGVFTMSLRSHQKYEINNHPDDINILSMTLRQKLVKDLLFHSNSDLESKKEKASRIRSNSIINFISEKEEKPISRSVSQSNSPINLDQLKNNRENHIEHSNLPENLIENENQRTKYMIRSQTPQNHIKEKQQYPYNVNSQELQNSTEETIQKQRYKKRKITSSIQNSI